MFVTKNFIIPFPFKYVILYLGNGVSSSLLIPQFKSHECSKYFSCLFPSHFPLEVSFYAEFLHQNISTIFYICYVVYFFLEFRNTISSMQLSNISY